MTARIATLDDIPALVEMGRKFHAMSPHKPMGDYDPDAIARVLGFLIESPDGLVVTNGQGTIGGLIAPVYFNPAKRLMEESFWWAEAGGRDLLKLFEAEAKRMGANFNGMSLLENARITAHDRVLRRSGYEPLERRYVKGL